MSELPQIPIGARVQYWTGARQGVGKVGSTRGEPYVLSGHTPVVFVTGHGACIALTHVQRIDVADELRIAAEMLREAAKNATAGPWTASPVSSPRSHATSAVYSLAHKTGTVESEVVASGLRDRAGGIVHPGNSVWIALADPELAEPLAHMLDGYALRYDDEVIDEWPEGPCCAEPSTCGGHGHVELHDNCGGVIGRDGDDGCPCFHNALTVARKIHGGAS